MEATQKHRPFYGWVIVGCCMLLAGAGIGIASNCVSVFVKPVSEALGVARGQFSLYATFSSVCSMVMAPFIGGFFEKYPFKRLMVIGCCAGAGTLMLYSFATSLWQFYAIAIMNGTLIGLMNGIPIALLLSRWFVDKRGLATGIAYTGSGLAATVMVPIVNKIIESSGWRGGYRTLSVIFICLTLPTILLLIKPRPEDVGQTALGAEKLAAKDGEAPRKTGFTRAEAVRMPAFWFFVASLFLTGFVGMGTQQHVIAYLTDVGYTSDFASSMFSLSMAVLMAGKVLLGYIFDKFGVRVGTVYMCAVFVASEVLLLTAGRDKGLAFGFAVIFGLANAMQTIPMPYFVSHLFGDLEYARIYGISSPFYMAGMSLGMPFSGFVYDATGSYMAAWAGYAVVIFLIMAILLAADISASKAKAKL
ncbi:MAG TPA: MFS transporter [Candidatus Acidoferrum sp.]|nr:MFS transporter [Candidatus Acidoferrum sp.]